MESRGRKRPKISTEQTRCCNGDAVKRAEKGRQSVSIAESSCERDLRRKSIPSGRHLGRNTINPGRYVTQADQEVNRWWDCSQKQSWISSWIRNSNGETLEILSGLRSTKDWLICGIRTPDSITSDRIWSRCSNMWLKLMRIPECGITELTEFTTRELRSSESSSKNTCRTDDSSRWKHDL